MVMLLIMKKVTNTPAGLVVSLRVKALSDEVASLLQAHKDREAFELLRTRAVPLCYVQPGHRMAQYFPKLVESDLN